MYLLDRICNKGIFSGDYNQRNYEELEKIYARAGIGLHSTVSSLYSTVYIILGTYL